MKACVTGGTGFMGTLLAQRLSERGEHVQCLVRRPDRCEDWARRLRVDIRKGDLLDMSSLVDAFSDCDTVFHTAAFATHWGTRQQYWDNNVTGTRNVMHAIA